MNMKKVWFLFLLIVFSATMIAGDKTPKNLKVLDFTSTKDVKKYMKIISKDLGVKCKYCHDMNDKSIDTEHKNIARFMMTMVQTQNDSVFNYEGASQISCWTCHRGSTAPELARPK
jgi:cytochrome c-type biogenesis protein CcmH/NrfF